MRSILIAGKRVSLSYNVLFVKDRKPNYLLGCIKAGYTKNKAFDNQYYLDIIFRASRKIKKLIIRPWNADEKTKGMRCSIPES